MVWLDNYIHTVTVVKNYIHTVYVILTYNYIHTVTVVKKFLSVTGFVAA